MAMCTLFIEIELREQKNMHGTESMENIHDTESMINILFLIRRQTPLEIPNWTQ